MAEVRTQLVSAIRKQLNKAARLHAQSREAMEKVQDVVAEGEAAADAADPEGEGQPPGEQVLPTTDEWIRLHKLTGLPIATLQRKVQSPYDCRLVVSREAPSISGGRKILCGEFPEFSQEFPFNLEDLKQSIAAKFGGDLWRLSIQDSAGQVIRDVRLRLALPPLNPGEAPEDPNDRNDDVASGFPEGFRGPPAHDLDEGMDDILEVEKKRYHIAAVRKGRKDMEAEAQSPEDDKFAQILEALKAKGGDGGNMAVLIGAMQASAQQQQRSLELVLSGLADKMSGQQQSQLQMFDILAKMMDSKAAAQAEVARVQMEGKRTEMDMMMRLVDGRREDKDMAMDKMLELLQLGMQWKSGTVPQAEGEAAAEKPDWIASLVQGLAALISSKVSVPAVENPAAAPQLTAQPTLRPDSGPTASEAQEAQSKRLAAIAEAAAKNAVARHKARQEVIAARRKAQTANGSAPAEPAAAEAGTPEVVEQRKALMSELLAMALLEVEELPVRSKTVQLAFDKAPAEWRAKLCSTGSALELSSYFKPYADMALVKQIEEKITPSPEKQQWLMTQAGILRNAFIKQAEAQRVQQAPPPAAAVAPVAPVVPPPPRPGSQGPRAAEPRGGPSALRPSSGPAATEEGGPANA